MNKLVLPAFALSAIACSAQQVTTFSFLDDIWNDPNGSQVGFVSQTASEANSSSTGTSTKNGITLTFTGSFFGTALNSPDSERVAGQGGSFTNATIINPNGFIFGTINDSNPINFAGNSFSGAVSNYQRWDFSFSEPIILSEFILQDIDSDANFRDIIAAEAFLTPAPGAAGTGLDASYTLFGNPSSLLRGNVTFDGNAIDAIGAPINLGNPNNTPEVRTSLSFDSTPISSFSVYSFSDNDIVHRISLNSSSFEVTAIPEPSTVILGFLSVGALFLRRRR